MNPSLDSNISKTIVVSVVVPCFNEESVISYTNERLTNVLSDLNINYEIIYISDGSTDKTNELLDEIYKQSNNVKLIKFSRNFGHQIAVTSGIDYAGGRAVILIDADLQDPPELIPKMLEKWQEGYEVVYCQRKARMGESRFKLFTAKWFYKILAYLSDVDIPANTGDFRLIDRKIVDVIKTMPERDRFIRGMVSWIGFNQFALQYERDERYAGQSKYPLSKMVKFAIDGILSFSIKPLRVSTVAGLVSSFFSFLGIIYALIMWMFGTPILGWTLMFIAIMFFGSVQLISLGIIGEYVGRSYAESKNRPLYVIGEKSGFKSK
jgi:dolichol-phosphate mannosyltransferase